MAAVALQAALPAHAAPALHVPRSPPTPTPFPANRFIHFMSRKDLVNYRFLYNPPHRHNTPA